MKLHFHNYIKRNSYYTHGDGVLGTVKLCLICGKIKVIGKITIPEDYIRISDEIKKGNYKEKKDDRQNN